MSQDAYWRRFTLARVVDGDTILARIDLGYYLTTEQMVRLLWVNAPELHDEDAAVRAAALASKDYTTQWFAAHADHDAGGWFYGRTEKDDSFGRWLMQIECGALHSLQTDLTETGHAVPYRVPKVLKSGA